jgi:hypothetical protein
VVKSVLLAVAIVGMRGCREPAPPLSAEHRFVIRAEHLTPVGALRELPPSVREVLPAPIAPERLIVAGCGPDHCLVHYDDGKHTGFRVVLLGLTGSNATVEWEGVTANRVRDLAQLKSLVLRGGIAGRAP